MQDQLWDAGPVKPTYRPSQTHRRKTCRHPGCTNPTRARSGAKYCDEHATCIDYNLTGRTHLETTACLRCGEPFDRNRFTHKAASDPTRAWNSYCPECRSLSPLKAGQLRSHRVPYQVAIGWLAQGSALACDLCGRTLNRKIHRGSSVVIDHDHGCCHGMSGSCGQCIRGVLCSQCNTGLGQLESLLDKLSFEAIADYIKHRF